MIMLLQGYFMIMLLQGYVKIMLRQRCDTNCLGYETVTFLVPFIMDTNGISRIDDDILLF